MSKRRRRKRKNSTVDIISVYGVLLFFYFFASGSAKTSILKPIILLTIILLIIAGTDILKKKWKKEKYLNSSLYVIDNMKGEEFEEFLKAHFEKLGYKVKLTPASNDYGADLILEKNDEKIAVQAKRYRDKVGNAAIQEVAGAIRYYNCTSGLVVTNSFFTKNAINLAEKCQIELWDRNTIKENFKIIEK